MSYHLENVDPANVHISLGQDGVQGLRLTANDRTVSAHSGRITTPRPWRRRGVRRCPTRLWCAGRLYLRNVVPGTYTHLEQVTNFLRDHVWGGDQVVTFVRKRFFQDAFVEKDVPTPAVTVPGGVASSAELPLAAALKSGAAVTAIVAEHLGIDAAASEAALPRENGIRSTTRLEFMSAR